GTAGGPGRGWVLGRRQVLFLSGGRPSTAVPLPPSLRCCRVLSPARREHGVAGVAGQGHRALPENRTRVVTERLPILERAPRLLPRLVHQSDTRKHDLGFSSVCQ
ncbi:hypothetical protein Nmel_010293, partial [Mimus melanotis]